MWPFRLGGNGNSSYLIYRGGRPGKREDFKIKITEMNWIWGQCLSAPSKKALNPAKTHQPKHSHSRRPQSSPKSQSPQSLESPPNPLWLSSFWDSKTLLYLSNDHRPKSNKPRKITIVGRLKPMRRRTKKTQNHWALGVVGLKLVPFSLITRDHMNPWSCPPRVNSLLFRYYLNLFSSYHTLVNVWCMYGLACEFRTKNSFFLWLLFYFSFS